jgi:uncharacterized protein (DUF2132 family)
MMEAEKNNDNKSKEKIEKKAPVKKVKRQPTEEELNHPLHGVKLATVLETLVEVYGWKYLAREVNINCFKHDPSIKVSLKFLRKFKWAREHVQDIYVDMVEQGIDQKVKKDRS